MGIAELLHRQTKGIFFVWKRKNGTPLITFLRNKENVSWQSQVNHALTEGKFLMLKLIGISYWWIETVITHHNEEEGCMVVNKPTISLLRLRELPEYVRLSTENGVDEMRGVWIPFALSYMKTIYQNSQSHHS